MCGHKNCTPTTFRPEAQGLGLRVRPGSSSRRRQISAGQDKNYLQELERIHFSLQFVLLPGLWCIPATRNALWTKCNAQALYIIHINVNKSVVTGQFMLVLVLENESISAKLFVLHYLIYLPSNECIKQYLHCFSPVSSSSCLSYSAFCEQNGKGVLELKSSVIVNKLEIAANICSTWQNGLTQHLPQKSTVPDERGPFPESRIWFMTGCNWVLNRGNLNFIFQVSSWKHLLSHLQVTSPTFPLNVELKPVSLVPVEGMTSLFCVGGLL